MAIESSYTFLVVSEITPKPTVVVTSIEAGQPVAVA